MSNILIVDDEQDIAELISDVLTDVGYKTTIANNGYQALDLVKSNKYDLILLDIMMPGISGNETCSKLRELTKCPIIFVSSKREYNSISIGDIYNLIRSFPSDVDSRAP